MSRQQCLYAAAPQSGTVVDFWANCENSDAISSQDEFCRLTRYSDGPFPLLVGEG